jgi:uncharacterized protein YprB with RNaseH-like and TPR domain
MLQNTFCHAPGIGPKSEERLWSAGVLSWQDALGAASLPLAPAKADSVCRSAAESVERLACRDARFFSDRLPSPEHWRLYPQFRDSVAYVDIETTGLGGPYAHITTIALYDGHSIRWYVHGEDLEEFCRDIEPYDLVVTYNGNAFDLPFIREHLGVPMRQAHIDLRYVLGSLGFRGGLKGCEQQLGVDRGDLDGIDGYFAVVLWRDYWRQGERKSLETLLAYNVADAVNLERLMVAAYNMKLPHPVFARTHRLPEPPCPEAPFCADAETVARLRREMVQA